MPKPRNTRERGPLRRILPVLALLLVGGLCGVAVALVQPPVYTAEARLTVGRSSLSANMIPGYASATQTLAANYARFITTDTDMKSVDGRTAGDVINVSASPVPESNVLRIEATATREESAVDAAQSAATALKGQVDQLVSDQTARTTLSRYTKISTRVLAMQEKVTEAQAEVAALRPGRNSNTAGSSTALDDAQAELVSRAAELLTLQAQQNALNSRYLQQANADNSQAELTIIQSARLVGDNRASRAELYGMAGFGIVAIIAYAVARLRNRRIIASESVTRDVVSQPTSRSPDPILSPAVQDEGRMFPVSNQQRRTPQSDQQEERLELMFTAAQSADRERAPRRQP